MRYRIMLCCLVAATHAAGVAQEKDTADRPTRKGDTLTVKGCLSGAALAATEASAPDVSALLANGLTFRLTGEKALVKRLRDEHDRRVVEVRGVLKSDLPQHDGQSHKLGNMRITIGAASPAAGRPEAEARRSLPVLEVKSFEGGSTSCGR